VANHQPGFLLRKLAGEEAAGDLMGDVVHGVALKAW
jgi:hypothetical protein